jgi:type II secretory pathway pseudopilin PulG
MSIKHLQNKGYTIIELMISISVFMVVVIYGMTSLLNANLVHKKSQDMRQAMDTLSFIMEDMSKNLRTGTTYHCDITQIGLGLNTPRSCASAGSIAFESAYGSTVNANDQWAYRIITTDGGATYNISRSTDSGSTWIQLNPAEMVITAASGFSVLGAEAPSASNQQQPFVTIRLAGSITYKGVVTPFSLETSVSQRLIDK